jgi:hypothetical protein
VQEEEETTNSRLTVMDVGPLIILGTFAPTDRKSRIMVINLDRMAPYEGTTRMRGLKERAAVAVGE